MVEIALTADGSHLWVRIPDGEGGFNAALIETARVIGLLRDAGYTVSDGGEDWRDDFNDDYEFDK